VSLIRHSSTEKFRNKRNPDETPVSAGIFFFFMAQQPPVGQGLLIIEASRSHSDTPQSVGLLRTSDRPIAKTSTWQYATLARDNYPCPGGIRIPASERSKTHAADRMAARIGSARLFEIIVSGYKITVLCWLPTPRYRHQESATLARQDMKKKQNLTET
jgi:hypothetical protein